MKAEHLVDNNIC